MWMRQTVLFKASYRELPDRNKWRHCAEYRRTTLFRTSVSNWQAPRVICFTLLSQTGRPLGLFFYQKKGAVGPALKARVRSLAIEGGQMQELKTWLREYRLPQRAINGRNRVPKAAFDQTGWYLLGDIRRIRVESVCIFLWRHLYGVHFSMTSFIWQ